MIKLDTKTHLEELIDIHKVSIEYIAFKIRVYRNTIDRWKKGYIIPSYADAREIFNILKGFRSANNNKSNKRCSYERRSNEPPVRRKR